MSTAHFSQNRYSLWVTALSSLASASAWHGLEQADSLAAALASFKLLSMKKLDEGSEGALLQPPYRVVAVFRSPCPEGQVLLEVTREGVSTSNRQPSWPIKSRSIFF